MSTPKQRRHMKAMQQLGASAALKMRREKRYQRLARNFVDERRQDKRTWKRYVDFLKRKQGQRVGAEAAGQALHEYYTHLSADVEKSQALTTVYSNLGISRSTMQTLIDRFESRRQLGSSDERTGTESTVFTPEVQLRMAKKIDHINSIGQAVTVRLLQRWLASSPDASDPHDEDREPLNVAESTVARWLGQMGYRSQEAKAGYRVTEERKARIREFLIDFSEAKKKEMSGEYVIAFMDESYLHVGHRMKKSIFPEGENRSVNTARAGKRMILVHAITEDGPLVAKEHCDPDTGIPKPEGWFHARSSTACPRLGGGAGVVGGRGARRKRNSTGRSDGDVGGGGGDADGRKRRATSGQGEGHPTTGGKAAPRRELNIRHVACGRANTEHQENENGGAQGGRAGGDGMAAVRNARQPSSNGNDRSGRILRSNTLATDGNRATSGG
ncbi:unnamed protein product, partial [Sphacelaria rigidula]